MSTNRNVEIYGFSIPIHIQQFLRYMIHDLGGTITYESWYFNVYPKLNIKIFFDPKTIDYDFIVLIMKKMVDFPGGGIRQLVPPCEDRLIYHRD